MRMYALGLMPLLTSAIIEFTSDDITQIAFADDVTGVGMLEMLKKWLDKIIYLGPFLGYFVEESKSWLVTKEKYLNLATQLFQNSTIKITSSGRRHLGAFIGTEEGTEKYIFQKVNNWKREIKLLTNIAKTEPHAAFCCFVHGMQHKFTYVMRTVPKISHLLTSLDDEINNFIKVLLNDHNFNGDERILFSLPAKFGGLGILIPSKNADQEYQNSLLMTKDAVSKIKEHQALYQDNQKTSNQNRNKIRNERKIMHETTLESLKTTSTNNLNQKVLEACAENGSSNWLTALPLKKFDFYLDKQSFWDGIRIRYNLPLQRLPSHCACGSSNDLQHALSCHKGGFIIERHNELRDITAEILQEHCSNVTIEPSLTPITGEEFSYASCNTTDEARSDISAKGFWIRGQTAFADIRVFNPLAKSHLKQSLSANHKKHENEKKRTYNQRINQVDHGSFTPLVFSCYGGMSRECGKFYSHAADKISEKRKVSKSLVSNWIKTKLSFALLRSCVLCVRGTRSKSCRNEVTSIAETDIAIAAIEANV